MIVLGLRYFPDRAAAMKETARVLSAGRRLALNVWGAFDRQPFHAALTNALGGFLGAEAKSAVADWALSPCCSLLPRRTDEPNNRPPTASPRRRVVI